MSRFEAITDGELTHEQSSLISKELEMAGRDYETIYKAGVTAVAYMGWLAIQSFDMTNYGERLADPNSSDAEKEAFCFGIANGYEVMLGVASYLTHMREGDSTRIGVDDDDSQLFMEVMGGKFSLPEGMLTDEGFDSDDSSELFFLTLGNRLAQDHHLFEVLESYEHILRTNGELDSYPTESEKEHHLAGLFHGFSSVYGFMVLLSEKERALGEIENYANGGSD